MDTIKQFVKWFGLPRLIIILFFIIILILAASTSMDMPTLMGDVIKRWLMYSLLVLAMVPGITSGIGPNFGVTIGIEGGLLAALITVEMRFYGLFASLDANPTASAAIQAIVAILLAIIISSVIGILYGMLLNRVKGSEMTVTTYVGLSVVALFNTLWLSLPFRSGTSIWPLAGEGLRNQINLEADFGGVLSRLWSFRIGGEGGTIIPTGLMLLFFLTCFCIWLFARSKAGMMMNAAGANPLFAKSAAINVNKMRILGTTISTALGGVGIICYAQSYGFLQLYNAPQMMGFTCVACILIGGATLKKARISHVIIGAFLFNGLMAVALPVANNLVPEGNLSEILRILISNGIILYAICKIDEDAGENPLNLFRKKKEAEK